MPCNICHTEEENDASHRSTTIHRFNYMLEQYQQNKKRSKISDGVELQIDVKTLNGFSYDFTREPSSKGIHYLNMTPDKFKQHGNKVEFKCRIKNARTRKQDPIVITYAGVLHPYMPYSMTDPSGGTDQEKLFVLEAGKTYTFIVKLQLQDNNVSNYKIPIFFTIQTLNRNKMEEEFSFARSIVVCIQDLDIEEAVFEKSPFTKTPWGKIEEFVPPVKVPGTPPDEFPIPIKYRKTLRWALTKDFGDGVLQEILGKLQPGSVTLKNYVEFWHVLLWLEEMCSEIGLSCYNMENVKLVYVDGSCLKLEVPGLAEKRPSVIKGDRIEVKVHGDHTAYQGVILKVEERNCIITGLHADIVTNIIYCPDLEMDVRFRLGRIQYERMHRGVEQVSMNGFLHQLFPREGLRNNIAQPTTITRNELFNKQIYTNREQMTAVEKIVNNTSQGAPYIVYGPPGTGKTVTIVEAIYQLKRLTKYKILICAPSNAACNMLTEKLKPFCTVKELRRVISENGDLSSVHDDILGYCNMIKEEDGTKLVTRFMRAELDNYRIIVTTLVLAGKFTREYHPDIVFLDEAAQAREPEACCAIGLLLKSKRLVLAGDHQQLGPIVHSKICIEYHYDVSLLERLSSFPVYKRDTENNYMTMLKLNFRSHPEILQLPNELFYDSQLKAVSAHAQSDILARTYLYKLIVDKGFHNQNGSPIEFCCVSAKERKEGRSPSYYNPSEVNMVIKYITILTSLQHIKVDPTEIGIVTPYIRQVYKIREALPFEYRDQIEVGTTEAFQGREKRVMIISTVRAQEDLLLHDKKYKLGFVKEPKRFNVAITRAKSKLIVIGNPSVLGKDVKWKALMDQANRLGTLCGAPYIERNQTVKDEIVRRFRYLKNKGTNNKN